MKETLINKVYCEPTTEAQWESLDDPDYMFPKDNDTEEENGRYVEQFIFYDDGMEVLVSSDSIYDKSKTKVSVEHFNDLHNDAIVDWRLKEVGFSFFEGVNGWVYIVQGGFIWYKKDISLELCIHGPGIHLNIDTFTELKAFMKALKK